jgi:predicted DNA-binding transcriptional regulator AlpA
MLGDMMKDRSTLLLSIREFCQETRQSVPTYYNARKKGLGPVEVRFGPGRRKVFIRREDADDWIQAQRQVPREPGAPSEDSEPIAHPSEQAEQFA